MINHIIDHALTSIGYTLNDMEDVHEGATEVEAVSTEAVGYLLINCITSIRKECKVIEEETEKRTYRPPYHQYRIRNLLHASMWTEKCL